MDSLVGSELVHSMLNAAGSMQRLTEELDRISLPPEDANDYDNTSRHHKRKSRTKPKPREQASPETVPHWTRRWTPEITQLSHKGDLSMEDTSSEFSGYDQPSTPSQMSNASSKFDSAFGSFPSQTDEDSLHSWSLSPSTVPPYDNYSEELQRLTQHLALQNLLYDSSTAREPPHLAPSSNEKLHRHHQSTSMHQKHSAPHTAAALDSPSSLSVPSLARRKKKKHHTSKRRNARTSTESHSPPRTVPYSYAHESWYPSTYSHSSSSSSLHDPRVLTTHSHTMSHESPVEVTYGTEQGGETPPAEELELQSYSNDEGRKQYVTHHCGRQGDSSGSTTPTVSASEIDETGPRKSVPLHIHPQIVVNPPPRHGAAWQQVPAQREKKESPTASAKQPSGARKHKVVTLRVSEDDVKGSEVREGWTTRFYQENITPQPSPQLPRRYHQPSPQLPRRYRDTGTSTQSVTPVQERANPIKRSASILQRLKRRKHGSFRYERRPKRHLPVKRAFSDRIAYQIRKGWVDYDEDLELISNPSRPRTIGRMVDTHAGRHHIVELHKPPSGRYGIYISEGGAFRRGIFISRFAEGVAAKFYSGLLSPGDEIIEVNGQPISDKSLDYVYNILASLDSVLLMILPVSARSDWC